MMPRTKAATWPIICNNIVRFSSTLLTVFGSFFACGADFDSSASAFSTRFFFHALGSGSGEIVLIGFGFSVSALLFGDDFLGLASE